MLDPAKLFNGLPTGLREPLIAAYVEVARNYAEHRWEPAELNGGKLCEAVYSIVDGATRGTYPTSPQKPPRMLEACRSVEQRQANPALSGDRSLRVLIPLLLPYLYEIRNNRGVGHIGGDVSPNSSDATTVFSCSNWIMAELIRIFHGISLDEAQLAVDTLVERKHPLVWDIEGTKRVLDPMMPCADQVLVLLYSSNGWVEEPDLRSWVEYKNTTNFRNKVLSALHKARLVEHDLLKQRVRITARGSRDVEVRILTGYKS